jgi:hypothetical protein
MPNFKIHHLYRKDYTSFQRYNQIADYIDVYLVTDNSQKVPITYILAAVDIQPTIYYPVDMLRLYGFLPPNYTDESTGFKIAFVINKGSFNFCFGILYTDIINYCSSQGINITQENIHIRLRGYPRDPSENDFCVVGGVGNTFIPGQAQLYNTSQNTHRLKTVQQIFSYVRVLTLDIWFWFERGFFNFTGCSGLFATENYDIILANEVVTSKEYRNNNYACLYSLSQIFRFNCPIFISSGNNVDDLNYHNYWFMIMPYATTIGAMSFFDTSNNEFTPPIPTPPPLGYYSISSGLNITTQNQLRYYSNGKYINVCSGTTTTGRTIPPIQSYAYAYQIGSVPPYPNDPVIYKGSDPGLYPGSLCTMAVYGGPYYGLVNGVAFNSTKRNQNPNPIIGTSYSVILAMAFYLLSSPNIRGSSAYEITQKFYIEPTVSNLFSYIACGQNVFSNNGIGYYKDARWAPSTGYGLPSSLLYIWGVLSVRNDQYLYLYTSSTSFVSIYGQRFDRKYRLDEADPVYAISNLPHLFTLLQFTLQDEENLVYRITSVLNIDLLDRQWKLLNINNRIINLRSYFVTDHIYIVDSQDTTSYLTINGINLDVSTTPYPWFIKTSFRSVGTIPIDPSYYVNICDTSQRYYLQGELDSGRSVPKMEDTFYANVITPLGYPIWSLQPQWLFIPLNHVNNTDLRQGWLYNLLSEKYLGYNEDGTLCFVDSIYDALVILHNFNYGSASIVTIDSLGDYRYMGLDENYNMIVALSTDKNNLEPIIPFSIDPSLMVKNEDILVLSGTNPGGTPCSICVQSVNSHAPSVQITETLSDQTAIDRGLAWQINSVQAGSLFSRRDITPFVLNTLMPTITLLNYPNQQDYPVYEFSNCFIAVQDEGFQPSMLRYLHDEQEDPITIEEQWSMKTRNGDVVGINYMYNNGVFYPETQNKTPPYDEIQTMTNNYDVSFGGHQPAMVNYALEHPSRYTIKQKIDVS